MKHRHSHEAASASEAADCLRQKSRRLTGPRQALLKVLAEKRSPMSCKELFERIGKGDCDLATIYRSLHLLESLGLVKRFDFGDGVARYEMVTAGEDGHHHHLVCIRCAGVVEIDDCFPQELQEKIERRNGFKSVTHKLEFFGVCPSCQ
ncbi:MAG TPA: Fur family transcriptional regulator [Verrucomicrobiae bacterium]|jgi:Fur family ferric uptake transcriptional regulator|nr:Fur family transcriptional regulator [Verrucomicrobiae bacterium]